MFIKRRLKRGLSLYNDDSTIVFTSTFTDHVFVA